MRRAESLPALSADERAHSERLIERIRAVMEREQGWLNFARFMELALYEPGLGYYSAGATKFGASGDFVTAPLVTPIFSRCLANQCAAVLAELRGGEILELGAGSGAMAATVLEHLATLDALPSRYLILEVSAELRARQQATLQARVPAQLERVQWLEALPERFIGVVLANEVLDALPVQRFRIREGQVRELGVSWQEGFRWSERAAPAVLVSAVRDIEKELGYSLPEGYVSEINLQLPAWLQGIAEPLARGAILLIDYGLPRREYYLEERSEGTLLCHFRHLAHDDPFINLGLQDIGAWVDFTAVAEAAVANGLDVSGFTTQAHFLLGTGLDRVIADMGDLGTPQRVALAGQIAQLTMPGEMGERFKVIGLTRDYSAPLGGFAVRDFAASL